MSSSRGTAVGQVGYGARPVSVDLARGQRLAENRPQGGGHSVIRPVGPRPTFAQIADRLALAQWPHQHIVLSSLDGGVGRTTLAGLLATTLASLPYAGAHRPVALGERHSHPLSTAAARWGAIDGRVPVDQGRSVSILSPDEADRESLIIVDQPGGLTQICDAARDYASPTFVLIIRPEPPSIAAAARALVWLHDRGTVSRRQVCVVINDGLRRTGRESRAAGVALTLRAGAVHRLPPHPTLGPGRDLPSGRHLARPVARALTRIALGVHSVTHPTTKPIAHLKEKIDA